VMLRVSFGLKEGGEGNMKNGVIQ
ncbi:hypothetical protein LCGC14_3004620, partial [marine sediment metagenome]